MNDGHNDRMRAILTARFMERFKRQITITIDGEGSHVTRLDGKPLTKPQARYLDGFFDAYWVHPVAEFHTKRALQHLGVECLNACTIELQRGGSKPVRAALNRVARAVNMVVQLRCGEHRTP